MIARASRLAAATAALLGLFATPALGYSTGDTSVGSSDPDGTDSTTQVLPRDAHGSGAIQALGKDLPSVAARNDLSSARLTQILTEDTSAWLSEDGQMYYREEMPAADLEAPALPDLPGELPSLDISPGATVGGTGTGSTTTPAYPVSQTFKLHSRPGATKQIFLDFDGAEIKGTAWNTGKALLGNALYTGYDSDGKPGTFSTAENAWMQEVWRQVSETYAPFDIDVTTQDTGTDARTRSSSSDTTFGTQVLFTNSTDAVKQACNSTCLGIAWVGTFSNVDPLGSYQPAFVFTKTTTSATVAAQGAAHEAGHTLGLHHDGTTTASYYAGTKAWGPVMGSATTRALTQFSKGEYAGANNTEDDLAIIQANGLSLRQDDYGNTYKTAANLGTKASYAVSGVIGSRNDADVFAVNLRCATNMTVTATGIGPQSAVDLKLDVLNGSGATVTSNNPAAGYTTANPPVSTGMSASATVKGAIGTYYLRVDGVGHGDPAGTGYSDYGSLGQYRLTAKGCASSTTQPVATQQDAVVTRPSVPQIGTGSSGTKGGPATAIARWAAPLRTGGAAITKYRVIARKLDSRGRVVRSYSSHFTKPGLRKLAIALPSGRYRFNVFAWNRVGISPSSRASNLVISR